MPSEDPAVGRDFDHAAALSALSEPSVASLRRRRERERPVVSPSAAAAAVASVASDARSGSSRSTASAARTSGRVAAPRGKDIPPAPPPQPRLDKLTMADMRERSREIEGEVEILVRHGRQNYKAGDYSLAAERFRQALSLAPLRQDLRAVLMKAVEAHTRQTAGRQEAAPGLEFPPRVPDSAPRFEPAAEGESLGAALAAERVESRSRSRRRSAQEKGAAPRAGEALKFALAVVIWGLSHVFSRRGAAFAAIVGAIFLWPALSGGLSRLLRPASQRQAETLLAQASELIVKGETAQAREVLIHADKLSPIFPKTEAQIDKLLAQACRDLGNKLYRNDKFEEAATLFEEAVRHDSSIPAYHGDLGMARLFAALKAYSPTRGSRSLDREGLNLALQAFNAALADEPGNVQWLWHAAKCRDRLGDAAGAKPLWRKIVEIEREGSYAKAALEALAQNS
jgi:tetratricopeptide (TPR) repeat protein